MKLLLMRHAQKGLQPFEDPGLTEEGLRQAEKIASLVQKNVLPKPTHIWASPKIRTSQTLQAVGDASKVKIQKTESLDVRLK
jgi:phosphohistidine phosphatase SixA